ncbi:MAG TPA: RNA polymerase sigma factor, partial [Blastocatellia bacterium]|nr:RNA polymerase sigma factor [Blastocatellia bacterium]
MLKPWAIQTDHEDLFIDRYDQMLRWSRKLAGSDRQAAEDLVHDVFVQFTLTRPKLETIQNLDGYLYTMLRNRHLSAVRRSVRNPLERLSAVEYDSVEIGLRAADPRRQLQVQEELRAVCSYACRRKDTSKSGCVLLLRFFHGFYPVEIARLLNSARAAVDIWLRIARNEAKSDLENPEHTGFAQTGVPSQADSDSLSPDDFAGNLRREVFRARVGDCLSAGEWKRLYGGRKQPLELPVLSHLVSCLECLNAVSRLLGLAPPSERHPTDSIGPDRRGGGAGPALPRESMAVGRRRSKDVFEHLPNKLSVSANGFFIGSQNVSSELNELTLSLKLDEPLGFIEVHSEQEVLLLAMPVEQPPSGPVEQFVAARLSEDRRIEASIDFSEAWPRLSVVYRNPSYESTAEAVPKSLADAGAFESLRESGAIIRIPDRGERSTSRLRDTITGVLRAARSVNFWSRPAVVTSALAVIIAAVVLLFKVWTPSVSALELLAHAVHAEDARNQTAGIVHHRTISLEARSLVSDTPVVRYKIETWRSAEPVGDVTRAIRLYDDNYRLCAGAWTLSDGSQSYFGAGAWTPSDGSQSYVGAPQLLAGSPVALRLAGAFAWQLEPSAETFAALIGNAAPGGVEQQPDSYVLQYLGQSPVEPRLVRASLRLARRDLRAIEQTVVIDTGQDRIQYRFVENQFEQRPSVSAPREVFAPEGGSKAEQRYGVTPPGSAALPQVSKQP